MTVLLLLATLSLYLMQASGGRSVIEINPTHFQEDVVVDDRVWLIEFYSAMCGACQEFAPAWEKVAQRAKSVQKGQVNLDDPQGMALAEKLGVLAEGVPNIRLFARQGDTRGVSLINGDSSLGAEEVSRQVKAALRGFDKGSDGYLVKRK